MLSTRDVQRKIRSVRSIEQICRAMKTVASIKLRAAEARIRAARPYADQMAQILGALSGAGIEHPLLEVRPVRAAGILVISADRGLCGSYNANVIRRAVTLAQETPRAELLPLGRKAADFCRRAGYAVRARLSPVGAEPDPGAVGAVADAARDVYLAREWDAVDLVYTRFVSAQQSQVVVERLLPLSAPAAVRREYICEPPAPQLLEALLPRYIRTRLWTAVLDAAASEHAARVAAMTLASDNAQELIEMLTIQYNKARQAAITAELLDIVGTAEALA